MISLGGGAVSVQIRGLEELQAANIKLLEAINPKGGLAIGVKVATQDLHKYAIGITHVHTGALRASHIADFASGGVQTYRYGIPIVDRAAGRIYIDPAARNPVTGEAPAEYGPVEHARGGSHAFYQRTVSERGSAAAYLAVAEIQKRLPRGNAGLRNIFGFLRIPGVL